MSADLHAMRFLLPILACWVNRMVGIALTLTTLGCGSRPCPPMAGAIVPVRSADQARARAFILQPRAAGFGMPGAPQLVNALWDDGLFVWQANQSERNGGLMSRVLSHDEAARAIADLNSAISSVSCSNREHTALDADYQLIGVLDGDSVLGLASIHPLYEDAPGVAVVNGEVYVRSTISSDVQITSAWSQFLTSWAQCTDTLGQFATLEQGTEFIERLSLSSASLGR